MLHNNLTDHIYPEISLKLHVSGYTIPCKWIVSLCPFHVDICIGTRPKVPMWNPSSLQLSCSPLKKLTNNSSPEPFCGELPLNYIFSPIKAQARCLFYLVIWLYYGSSLNSLSEKSELYAIYLWSLFWFACSGWKKTNTFMQRSFSLPAPLRLNVRFN
jgi:hypothetical protein